MDIQPIHLYEAAVGISQGSGRLGVKEGREWDDQRQDDDDEKDDEEEDEEIAKRRFHKGGYE
jgi:hypothetical protein